MTTSNGTSDSGLLDAARRDYLKTLTNDTQVIESLFDYCQNRFDISAVPDDFQLPMADEPHLEDWRQIAARAGDEPFETLRECMVQLRVPVREGISSTPEYAAAVRRGQAFSEETFDGTLTLRSPGQLRFFIHEHGAGALPVFTTPDRVDFELLYQALVERHEPVPLNVSVNAQLISGSINWYRVMQYRNRWFVANPGANWGAEMKRVAAEERWRFYDRFMLLGEEDYSSVRSEELGLHLSEDDWLEKSTVFRLEHEFMHYTTKRMFDSMNLNLFDETFCDWVGMMCAMGRYRVHWFLAFLGIDKDGSLRDDGRFRAYSKELDEAAQTILAQMMVRVAVNLETLTERYLENGNHLRFALTLTQMTLELIACDDHCEHFERASAAMEPLLARAGTA
ncbi:MAG: hypothetical protein AAF458_02065 [Pseudomonadota bacterium]